MSTMKTINTIRKALSPVLLLSYFLTAPFANALEYQADETRYPVIFAHGFGGFDSIGGYHYFGEDYWGTFIGDSCQFLELNGCNDWLRSGQQTNNKAVAFAVTPLQNSEVRGEELFNHVLNFMASTGHTHVSLVGHSQGGIDIRKVAYRLNEHFGERRVKALISISSPNRGISYAKRALDLYTRNEDNIFCKLLPPLDNGNDPCWSAGLALADTLSDFMNGHGQGTNDAIAGVLSITYKDYEPNDGITTGIKDFNQRYNVSSSVAEYYASIVTAQDNGNRHPLYSALELALNYNADGDGYCLDDCNNNGTAGTGDGIIYDGDDDGVIDLSSQQMGYRLQYHPDDCAGLFCVLGDPLDTFTEVSSTGYVSDLDAPNATQMTSKAGVLDSDHSDMLSLGPDDIDEEEFYAALIDFIHSKGF